MRQQQQFKVLDLFSGLEGWSAPWRDHGHLVYRVELNEQFPAEHRDIRTFDPVNLPWTPDIILASPPCTGFTVMQIGRNWNHDHTPKTEAAELGLSLLRHTLDIIAQVNPRWWVLENPVGKMRKLPIMQDFDRRTVTYCQYGESRMKPTDLWGKFPVGLTLHPMCKKGDPCHTRAPRGSYSGTQGMSSAEAAKVPRQLSLEILKACLWEGSM